MNNRIIKKEYISSGTFGDVYKLTTADNHVYALKVFRHVADQEGIKTEINNLCRLQHPHIVRIYGCCSISEKQNLPKNSMLMEFCPSDLRKAVQQGIAPSRAFRLFIEILQGMEFIHEHNMVHNDLKPDNIFLDYKDAIKIGDFGLARKCARSQCHGPIQGTSLYLPPEAVQFPWPVHSSKTDMYAIGIITFEMYVRLSGKNFASVIQQLKEEPQRITYEKLSRLNISPMKYEIIVQLLSKTAQQRPSARDLLCHLNVGNQCTRMPQQQACSSQWWNDIGAVCAGAVCTVVLGGLIFEIVRRKCHH